MEDYKKREFCNNIKCPVQVELNKHIENSAEYNAIRGLCSSNCLQSADNFLIWLKNNQYNIVNAKDSEHLEAEGFDSLAENHVEKLETLAKFENTAWRFHRAISQQGFMIMKNR